MCPKKKLLSFILLGLFCLCVAGCSGGDGGPSTTAAPTGVAATQVSSTSATITWNTVAGATSYNLYWSTTAGVTPANGTKIAGVTSPYTQTGLTDGYTYYYVVTAVSSLGESAPSSQASTSLTPPSAPTGVTAIPASSTSAAITWNAVEGATSYNLYWSTTSGVTPANGTKIAGVTSPYTQAGLTDGYTYYYVVTAVNAVGESTASSQASLSLMPPSVPTGVTATPGNGQIQVSWTAGSGAASYNIYYSATSGAGTGGTKITGASNPYSLTGLTGEKPYYFVVTAVNIFGESSASSQVSATPQTVNVSGNWVGTYTSTAHGSGPGTIAITQTGTSISGTVDSTFNGTYGILHVTGTIVGATTGATITATQVHLSTTVNVGGTNYACTGIFSGGATVNTQANPMTGAFNLTGNWSPSYCGGSDTITGTGTLQ